MEITVLLKLTTIKNTETHLASGLPFVSIQRKTESGRLIPIHREKKIEHHFYFSSALHAVFFSPREEIVTPRRRRRRRRRRAGVGTRVLAHSRVDPAMGLLSSASRSCCCCSWVRGGCASCCSWIRGFCGGGGGATTSAQDTAASDAKKRKKRKWVVRGVFGKAAREAEEPLTLETMKKRKSAATSPELEKNKWGTKKNWKKKKGKTQPTGLASLVKEISLESNKIYYHFFPFFFS